MGWEAVDNFIRLLDRLLETERGSAALDRHAAGDRFRHPHARVRSRKTIELVKGLSNGPACRSPPCSSIAPAPNWSAATTNAPPPSDERGQAGRDRHRGRASCWSRCGAGRTWSFPPPIHHQRPATHDPRTVRRSGAGADHGDHHSFGFSRGMPPLADLIFDMRFLANPHWIEDLRPMTGQDAGGDYIRQDPAFDEAFARIRDLLLLLLPRFEEHGKAYVNIAFGCTGGRHRSVFMAEQIASALRDAGFSPIAQKSGVTGG
jgi:UPF0042 nucleotide-binding protein